MRYHRRVKKTESVKNAENIRQIYNYHCNVLYFFVTYDHPTSSNIKIEKSSKRCVRLSWAKPRKEFKSFLLSRSFWIVIYYFNILVSDVISLSITRLFFLNPSVVVPRELLFSISKTQTHCCSFFNFSTTVRTPSSRSRQFKVA